MSDIKEQAKVEDAKAMANGVWAKYIVLCGKVYDFFAALLRGQHKHTPETLKVSRIPKQRRVKMSALKLVKAVAVALSAVAMVAGAAESEMVEGRGVGANRAEALKDAYRDAIERAVGMYVDAEQKMKNEELVEDQILTQSNAYIESCEVTTEKTKPNGLVEIRISAEVKKSALTKKLSDMMPKQTFALGDDAQNIHSRVVTKEKRNIDAAALLENALRGFNPVKQLMKLSLSSTEPLIRNVSKDVCEKGKERTLYRFRFTVDEMKYYGEFIPPLVKVLDQIALKPPKTVRLTSVDLQNEMYNYSDEKAQFLEGKWERADDIFEDGRSIFDFGCPDADGGVYVGDIGLSDGNGKSWCVSHGTICGVDIAEVDDNPYTEPERFTKGGVFRALVIVKMNKSRTVIQAKEYALPPECASVVQKWQWSFRGVHEPTDAETMYNIVFKDGSGEEVVAASVSFKNSTLSNVLLGHISYFSAPFSRDGYAWYISPMVHCDAAAYERWIGFDIPRDELPNIKSVTVELAE